MKEILHNYRTLESDADSGLKGILVQVLSNVLLFMLIFGMSATVNIRRIKQQLRNCYAISAGVCMQFFIMPFLGYIAVMSLKNYGLTTPMGITLLIVTSSPGGSYSNWWCSLFNADLALSVAMTALSTFISIAALPINLLMYAHFAYGFEGGEEKHILSSVDFPKLIISLGIVIFGILSGLYASYKFESPKFQRTANAGGTISGILLIVVSAVFSTTGGSDAKPWNQHWTFYVGVALPCIGGLVIANLIAKLIKLEKPEIVTLSVECSYQNTGIATTAVLAMFSDPEKVAQAMAVPLFYGVVEMIVLGLYCVVAWKLGWTKAPREEKICIVMSKTYEVVDGNDRIEIEGLEDSIQADGKSHQLRKRADTSNSDGTISISDVSSGNSSGQRSFDASSNASKKKKFKHTRSLPPRVDENDIERQRIFHTIREESESGIEVSEHELRQVPRFLSLKGQSPDEESLGEDAL